MRRPHLIAVAALAAVLPLGLAACGGGETKTVTQERTVTAVSPEPAPAPAPAPPASPEGPRTQPIEGTTDSQGDLVTPGPFEPGGLTAIVKQLTKQLGYTPRFLEIAVYDSYVIFQVQQKAVKRYVDQYVWRNGQIDGPTPVHLTGDPKDLPANLFVAEQVNLKAVPRLVARGNALPIEGSQTGGVIIERGLPFTSEVRFLVNVNGTRESKQIRANARGRVTEII